MNPIEALLTLIEAYVWVWWLIGMAIGIAMAVGLYVAIVGSVFYYPWVWWRNRGRVIPPPSCFVCSTPTPIENRLGPPGSTDNMFCSEECKHRFWNPTGPNIRRVR